VSDEQRRFRRAAFAAFTCAALNAGAAVAMLLFLRPGLLPSPQRLDFIREFELPWRASWALWVITAFSLAAFYLSFQRATGGPRIAAWIAIAGLLPDIGAEMIYIALYPALATADLARHDRLCAILSATLGNGAYTVAWHLLARRAGLPRASLLLSVPGIAAGYLMALSGIVYWEAGLAISTTVAIPAFTLWALVAGRFCWKKAAGAATMSPHV
jgi:hypothetical protein